jgi:hypothetical protein
MTVIWEVARQATHRIVPKYAVRDLATQRHSAIDEERARIYERMMVMEYVMDQERSAAIGLRALNDAESRGVAYGVALGSTCLGVVCDTIGRFRWAEGYHGRGLAAAAQVDNSRLVGIAHFGIGYHAQHVGDWTHALENYDEAADIAWREGQLHLWSTIQVWRTWMRAWRDNVAVVAKDLRIAIQASRDGADRVGTAWLEALRGFLLVLAGDLDQGIREQQSAVAVLERVPEYQGATGVRGNLARSLIWQGALGEAEHVIGTAQALIAEHKVRGLACTSVILADAEAKVARAERVTEAERKQALDQARVACQRALASGAQVERLATCSPRWNPTRRT